MILLFSVFLTDKSSTSGHWDKLREQGHPGVTLDRGFLRDDDKISVTKYSISSLAKYYSWSKAIIKIELGSNYDTEKNKQELKEYVLNEFKGIDIIYSDKRNLIQKDYIETYNLIDDDFIYYCSNHDHIVLDTTPEYLKSILDYSSNLPSVKYPTITYSHWPEYIRTSKSGFIDHFQQFPTSFNNFEIKDKGIQVENMLDTNNVTIISKDLYKNWFLENNWDDALPYFPNTFKSGHIELSRPEGVGIIDLNSLRSNIFKNPLPKQTLITPYKEITRHFDGYAHQGITNNQSPSLEIPPGFFENNIKIRYGYEDRKKDWVNINPLSKNYYAHDKSGVDYKFTIEEIPLFWKNKISEIDVKPNLNKEELIQHRLQSIMDMIYSSATVYPDKYHSYISQELVDKIYKKYLEIHPEYTI